MPRDTQIIPQYSFPHEEVIINDNSAKDLDDNNVSVVSYPYICVFASPKGIDGKLVSVSSLKNYRAMFGNTNFKKYGQPHLMPEAILSQPNTTVWAMRVMPEDALYANSVLSMWYKADPDKKVFRIKFTTKSIGLDSNPDIDEEEMKKILSDRDLIIDFANNTDGVAVDGVYVDEEGYTQVPLAVFTAIGRGRYGQNIRWRVTPAADYEKETGIKVYNFEILDVENGAMVLDSHISSIVSSAKVKETTLSMTKFRILILRNLVRISISLKIMSLKLMKHMLISVQK